MNFYYWDTYFTNLGYVPNANYRLDRSQPPVFTAGVWDLYCFKKDVHVIEKYIDSIIKELEFWKYDRMTPCGLNAYGTNATKTELLKNCEPLCRRIGAKVPDKAEDKMKLCYNLYAIAESGWDFTPRFGTEENAFAAEEFVQVDLNSLLFRI